MSGLVCHSCIALIPEANLATIHSAVTHSLDFSAAMRVHVTSADCSDIQLVKLTQLLTMIKKSVYLKLNAFCT